MDTVDNESYETSRRELVVCRQKYQGGQNFYGQRAVEKRDEKKMGINAIAGCVASP